MGKVMAVNISEKRGTQKRNVHRVKLIKEYGIEEDAHAGKWHRQVSLLSYEKIEEFKKKGAPVQDGAFGENIIVKGFDFKKLPVGSRFRCNDVILEMTQIGKECHSGCEIFQVMGDCIMPREGVFARVLQGGTISEGDEMTLLSDTLEEEKEFAPIVTLKFAKEKVFFGPGIAALLTLIHETGNVKKAAEKMGVSYTKSWRIINTAEKHLGYELVERHQGGAAGGGSRLTHKGQEFVEKYYQLENETNAFVRGRFGDLFQFRT